MKKKTTQSVISANDVTFRKAKIKDLTALLKVESASFNYDQLSRRNFHWMITKAKSLFLVVEYQDKVIGYGLVLLNRGTSLARLYSIAILPDFNGSGIGGKLLNALEVRAAEEGCAYLRLEVKATNLGAIRLYKKNRYVLFGEKKDYYDDGSTALCFEKQITFLKTAPRSKFLYYQQTTEFTCGPACLMMAMASLNAKFRLNVIEELQIWREATTIFMTSGHGGCDGRGLALAAWRRGFKAHLYVSSLGPLFSNSVRGEEKKKVIKLVHEHFVKKSDETNIKVFKKKFSAAQVKEVLDLGGIPIVLVSTYHFDRSKSPHWVLVTGADDNFIYIHDPVYYQNDHEGLTSKLHIPIPKQQFDKVTQWGKAKVRSAVIIFDT